MACTWTRRCPSAHVGWSIGPIFASADTFAIEVAGHTTHGAYPHTGIDPIPIAAEMVQALQLIVSRQIDAQNPKVLTIGSIQGGNRHNIIADSGACAGPCAPWTPACARSMKDRIARVVAGVAEANGTTATLRFVDDGVPPTRNEAAPHPGLGAEPAAGVRRRAHPRGRAADGRGGLRGVRGAGPRAST